jgi:hypothetical protein
MNKMLIITAAAGLAALAAGSFADDQKMKVTVEASRIVPADVGHTYAGIPIKSFSLSYEVSIDDLDVTSSAGLAAAEKRVNNAALAACKEINRESTGLSPLGSSTLSPSDEVCARDAARKTMVKLHKAIAAAAKVPNK